MYYKTPEEFSNKRVTKKLLKNSPRLVKIFAEYYDIYNMDKKPTIDQLFALSFKYQMFVWIDFFNTIGIKFEYTDGYYKVLFDRENSAYQFLSNDNTILEIIHINANSSDLFEQAVVYLINNIDLPF